MALCKNINFLTKTQYDVVTNPSTDELWAVETPAIVETYRNGTEWYRVYSDGWCEQGGACTLGTFTYSFLKQYTSTPTVTITKASDYAGSADTRDIGFNSMPTTTGFTLFNQFTSTYFLGANWYACGYVS